MADGKKVYLDYNATTPLELEVVGAITSSLTKAWGNPSSSHDAGVKAKKVIDEARCNVANMIGAKSSDIIFTSGGTEGNNMIIQTAVKYAYHDMSNGYAGGDNHDKLPHFITSNLEHDSVKLVLEHLAEEGTASVTFVPASSKTGQVDVDDVLSAIRPSTCMITVMMANNETGVIQPIKMISEKLRQINQSRRILPKILLHTDAAQAIGKIEVDVEDLGVDYLTVVGHKFYGPRIGAIYVRNLGNKDVPLYPMLYGGGQERNYRPGTENTVMIAGLGKAAELVVKNIICYKNHLSSVRDYLEIKLQEAFKDRIHLNGKFPSSERLPNTCNVSILSDKLQGHKVLSNCRILQASIGAACHSQNRPSPILLAIGVPESVARNALRLSVGRETTKDDIDCVIQDLIQAVNQLENHTKET
ncbi:selenocysteine lyase-like isoform X1 [Mytilus californianus]|uniref:selenocysteine lyase-like isoform X1 n=2 Tax=Mytilus californianus TaxID=6549 RepID=UPI00224711B8|nr:selenocysteine lyase-like isoform X1 [Mytilus californianus]